MQQKLPAQPPRMMRVQDVLIPVALHDFRQQEGSRLMCGPSVSELIASIETLSFDGSNGACPLNGGQQS